jgi:phosphatidylserine/phosphatidylglycerophosphate/cardiolipin synthase-like enzyme
MNTEINSANIYYHGEGWAATMAAECAGAQKTIHISALSMLPPTPNATGDWPDLWRAWCAAAKRGIAVNVWLPAPTPIHQATRQNSTTGGKIILNGMGIHYITGSRLLHAKTAVIDARTVWIGSGNFTAAAAHHNYEAYLRAECPTIAKQIIDRWESLA